jgi:hypothetical protein
MFNRSWCRGVGRRLCSPGTNCLFNLFVAGLVDVTCPLRSRCWCFLPPPSPLPLRTSEGRVRKAVGGMGDQRWVSCGREREAGGAPHTVLVMPQWAVACSSGRLGYLPCHYLRAFLESGSLLTPPTLPPTVLSPLVLQRCMAAGWDCLSVTLWCGVNGVAGGAVGLQ